MRLSHGVYLTTHPLAFPVMAAALVLAGCATAGTPGPAPANPAPGPLPPIAMPEATPVGQAALAGLLAGRFDNDLQVLFADETGLPAGPLRERTHVSVSAVDGEAPFGHVVLSVRQHGRDPAAPPAAEALWVLAPAGADGSVAMRVIAAGGAPVGPAPCEALWRPSADGEWRVADASPGCEAAPAVAGLAVDARGWSAGGRTLRRANGFRCWAATLAGARPGDSGAGLRDWTFRRDLPIHDQGGEIALEGADGGRWFLRLRAVEWPSGPNRPSLTLYVHEAGNDRALSYAWGEIDTDRLGINLRFLQASCTRDGSDAG
jgi:hypothetical protein